MRLFSLVLRRWLFAIALVAVGCNALTGVGDFSVVEATDAGIEAAAPIVDSGNDVQAPIDDEGGVDASSEDADATIADADADVTITPALPVSCADVKKQSPSSASGNYKIDPDGNGAVIPYFVFCDMTTAGGGWTEIFRWTEELNDSNVGYTSGSTALMNAVSTVLLVHRDSTGGVVSNYATFAIPKDWRTVPPFVDQQSNANVSVSINGAAPTTAQLEYGYDDFDTTCDGVWQPGDGDFYGRICIDGTTAPFFNGFNAGDDDNCTTSDQAYNAQQCSASQAFSIAVK